MHCAVSEETHTHPVENSCREGILRVEILEAKYEAKLEWGGGGWYFLELHIV